jgi:hypothetical protein
MTKKEFSEIVIVFFGSIVSGFAAIFGVIVFMLKTGFMDGYKFMENEYDKYAKKWLDKNSRGA